MKKNKEDGYFTIPIKEGVKFTDKELKDEILRFKKNYHKTQKQNRIQFWGLIILFILVGFGSKLYGYDNYEQMIENEAPTLKSAREEARKIIIPTSPVSCETGKVIKFHGYGGLDKEFRLYYRSLFEGFHFQFQKDWFSQNTAVFDKKRVLCVNKKRHEQSFINHYKKLIKSEGGLK